MTLRLDTLLTGILLVTTTACMEMEAGEPEGEEAPEQEVLAGQKTGSDLFHREAFGGNGRTCGTCHPKEKGTVSPADVQAAFSKNPNGPLFRHDAADVMGGNTFNRVRTHATILIELPLPDNVRIVGSDARSVTVARGIPTTNNTPALDPVLMQDGRAPNLVEQARGAIVGHAQTTNGTNAELNAIADFELTLFNRPNMSALAKQGVRPTMPLGVTDAEKRGRRFFIADGQTDPDLVGEEPSLQQACGFCHSGDMLNSTSEFFGLAVAPGIPEGFRFFTALVSDLNFMGNPTYDFEFTNPDGTVTVVNSPDPGTSLIDGAAPPLGNGFFKIPSLWGIKDTAPYFHDNSAKNLTQLMDHYQIALDIISDGAIVLTAQDKVDIEAYLKLL